MTYEDFKIKAKKILEILKIPFVPRITVRTCKYKGRTIYEERIIQDYD